MTHKELKPMMTFNEMKSYCELKGLPTTPQFVGAFARSQRYEKVITQKNNVITIIYTLSNEE